MEKQFVGRHSNREPGRLKFLRNRKIFNIHGHSKIVDRPIINSIVTVGRVSLAENHFDLLLMRRFIYIDGWNDS